MRKLLATLAVGLLCGAALGTAPARAAFGFDDFEVGFHEADGSPVTQAGAHPFAFDTILDVNTTIDEGLEIPDGETKDLTLGQVIGFAGDPQATPKCTNAEFTDIVNGAAQCPDASALGIAEVKIAFSPFPPGSNEALHVPVFNLTPPPGAPAKLGFVVLNEAVTIEAGLSQFPPYKIVAKLTRIPQVALFYSSKVTLWGNPADKAHDPYRGKCLDGALSEEVVSNGLCPAGIPDRPFITLPRSCRGPLQATLFATAWGDPQQTSSRQAQIPGMTDCGELSFLPDTEARPSSRAAESPVGLRFKLTLKNEGLTSSKGNANADMERVTTLLPPGVTANPSAAEGLGVCTLAQYQSATLTDPGCPESSKLGSVSVRTPLLEDPLEGSLFLAEPDDPATAAKENPFDTLLALYIVIRSPRYGVVVAQAGKVEPDPATGQLMTTFDGLPEVPLSEVDLRFREGPRSPLVTPPLCGTYDTNSLIYPTSGAAPSESDASFEITSGPGGGPCPAGTPPFQPGFSAGTLNNAAATYSPLAMRFTRNDGEQEMTRLSAKLPPGLLGKLAGLAQCSQGAIEAARSKTGRAELASPSCPGSSRIGSTLGGAGVGPDLTYVAGSLYLGGPYHGDPLSVVAITPAVAGPFDIGTVVVQEALTLNPVTAEVEVDGSASDPIPRILDGIPLKLRDLRVDADRPDFTLNPTSCEPETVTATLWGSGGPASLASRFQAAGCASLDFRPKLKLQLKGATKRIGHPALRAVLTAKPGEANIARAQVNLPHGEFLDQGNLNKTCTRPVLLAGNCPASSVYGKAKAWTPLLDKPLQGNVYLVGGYGYKLPALVADLNGLVRVTLIGKVDSGKNKGIRNTFELVPDAPVEKFELAMKGGKRYGLLENSENLCRAKKAKRRAIVRFTGQNGKVEHFKPVVRNDCGKKGKKKHKRTAKRPPRR